MPLIPIVLAAGLTGGGVGFFAAGGFNSVAKTAGYAVILGLIFLIAKVYL
ncbi:hypothetical protein [Vibrio cincinnatiensis]|nr:hypothetical protein [Vibrio cincinnatiensis]